MGSFARFGTVHDRQYRPRIDLQHPDRKPSPRMKIFGAVFFSNLDVPSHMVRQIHYRELVPDAVGGLEELESAIEAADIDETLVELVKLRVSQINGCAYCVDVHSARARDLGVDDRRIAAVSAWQESPFFDDREAAALHLAEALTRVADGTPPDSVYQKAYDHFDDRTLAVLVMAINAINSWNRLWVSFRTPELPETNGE